MKTLKERLRFVLARCFEGNMSAWANAAENVTRVHVAKLLERDSTDEGKVEVRIIEKLAAAAGVSPGWLAYGVGDPGDPKWLVADDPQVSDFFIALADPPGLKDWVLSRRRPLTVSQVWDVIVAYREVPGLAREKDGQPKDGWDKFAADVLARKLPPPKRGGAEAVAALERSQLDNPPSGFRSPSGKVTKKKRKSG